MQFESIQVKISIIFCIENGVEFRIGANQSESDLSVEYSSDQYGTVSNLGVPDKEIIDFLIFDGWTDDILLFWLLNFFNLLLFLLF